MIPNCQSLYCLIWVWHSQVNPLAASPAANSVQQRSLRPVLHFSARTCLHVQFQTQSIMKQGTNSEVECLRTWKRIEAPLNEYKGNYPHTRESKLSREKYSEKMHNHHSSGTQPTSRCPLPLLCNDCCPTVTEPRPRSAFQLQFTLP